MKFRIALAPTLTLLVVFMGCSGSSNSEDNPGSGEIGGNSNGAGTSSVTGGAKTSGGTKSVGGSGNTQTPSGGLASAGGSNAGTGGSRAAGGSVPSGAGTSSVAVTGGAVSTGGVRNTGGAAVTGGAVSTGGVAHTGGAAVTGGAVSTGGIAHTGGAAVTGGAVSTGGVAHTGGAAVTGGAVSTGGVANTGGATGTSTSQKSATIMFVHHSTGGVIWQGGVPQWFTNYNTTNGTNYVITELGFPKDSPYGWNNYPYDYWNIWVNHAGSAPYMEEPTLEMLTQQYDVIIWKHCFPVSNINADTGSPDIASSIKSLENYKLQYDALKAKMHQFPTNRFIVWTLPALRPIDTDPDSAARAQTFTSWVKTTWDEPNDNVFVWDFRALETGGDEYILPENESEDAHPNSTFAAVVAPYFAQRIVDVIQGRGDTGSLTGN